MAIGYGATGVVCLTVLVVWLLIDLPDLHVLALTITSIAIAGVFPMLFWVHEDDLGGDRPSRGSNQPGLRLEGGRRPRRRQAGLSGRGGSVKEIPSV